MPPPEPPATSGWQPGSTIDGYRLERRLGSGGMAEVWAATQLATGTVRALKTLLPGATPEEHARLVREGQVLAALEGHPHLIAVHSAGHAAGRGYLVLDYAPGGDLAQLLKAGPLPADRVRALGVALADALTHVHAHGKLHRDLKPQNVLFGDDARPLLCDFGLVGGVQRGSLTRTGDLLGTPAYMAPEQASSAPVDARTDVYGLGALLYQALCGQPPFTAATPIACLQRVVQEPPPPPSQVYPPADPELERVVLRALAKDPARRYPDVLALRAALEGEAEARAPTALLGVAATLALVAATAATVTVWLSYSSGQGAADTPRAPSTSDPAPASTETEPEATPADPMAEALARLRERLPSPEEARAKTPDPESAIAALGLQKGSLAIGAKLLGKRDEPPAVEAGLAGAWLLLAHDLGHPRAAGFLAQLLDKPEAEALCPDATERDALIVALLRHSGNAGCLSAIETIALAMHDEDPRFAADAAELDRMLQKRDAIEDRSQGHASTLRKIRIKILALSRRVPERAPPPEVLLAHADALCTPADWEHASPSSRPWILARRREAGRALGEAVFAELRAVPFDPSALDDSGLRASHALDPEDLGADGGYPAFVTANMLSNVTRNTTTSDPSRFMRQAALLFVLAGEAGNAKSWFELHVALTFARGEGYDWVPERIEAGIEACLQRGHEAGDTEATVEVAYEALSPPKGVPPDPTYARALLQPLGDAPPQRFRTLWKLAASHALLLLKHPEVEAPLGPRPTLELLRRAIAEAKKDPTQAGRGKQLDSLRKRVEDLARRSE